MKDTYSSTSPGKADRRQGIDRLYRLLIESVTDYALFVLDPQGNVMSWNPGAQRFKGYTADEIIGRHFSVFYPETDIAAGKPEHELEVASRTGRFEDEGWRIRKDGSRFWANVVITALHDPDGSLVGFAKITRDLTDRRAVEEQARQLAAQEAARAEAERRSAELSDLNDELQQQAIELETQFEESQSLTEELEQSSEALESSLREAEEASAAAQRAEMFARYLAEASAIFASSLDYRTTLDQFAHKVVPELGDWCSVELVDDAGELYQAVVAHVDPAKEQWARSLSEKYPTPPDSPTGAPNVLRTGRAELHASIPDEVLVAGAIDDEHLHILRELGIVSAMMVPLTARDRTLGVLTLVSAESKRTYSDRDLALAVELGHRAAIAVDNARLHRDAIEARQAAEQANAAKMQFLAVMSHELRTPLNAIGGYAQLLQMGLRGPVTPEQSEDLERIERSQHALLSVINDILNYARIEAGRLQFTVEDVPVQPLLTDLEALVLPQLREKRLTLVSHPTSGALVARADGEKVRQVLLNLLSNAIKFTDSGGTIALEAAGDGTALRIEVVDTGRGIDPDQLQSIFEPFVQLDRSLTSTRDGSGLGLSISRDLARGMGGNLTAVSTPGVGSRFALTLPRASN